MTHEVSGRSKNLQQAVKKAAQILLGNSGPVRDCSVYIGNHHGNHPTTLILDPALTAVDVRIYQYLCHHLAGGYGMEASPTPPYSLISKHLRITKPTIVNSIIRLRLTRWIIRLEQVRDDQGRFRGQVFAFVDQPRALVDTLKMDEGYLDLVRETARHHGDRRTSRVAKAVLAAIEAQIAEGEDPLHQRPDPLEERRQAIMDLDAQQPQARFFSVNLGVLFAREEKTLPGGSHQPGQDVLPGDFRPGQNALPGFLPGQKTLPGDFQPGQKNLPGHQPGQEILPGQQVIDSEGNEKTLPGALYSTVGIVSNVQTATDQTPVPQPPVSRLNDLNWHDTWLAGINEAQREAISKALQPLSAIAAQAILDALAYRYQSMRLRGAEPLRKGPLAYIRSLIKQLRSGTLEAVSPDKLDTLDTPVSRSDKASGGGKQPIQASSTSMLDYQRIQLVQEIQGLGKLLGQLPETPLHQSTRAGLQRQIQELERQLAEVKLQQAG